MTLRLRDYEPAADFDGMFAITREIVGLLTEDEARHVLSQYPEKVCVAKVATTNDGEIIGFCAATHPYWNAVAIIEYLVIAPEKRRRGIGRALVRAVESEIALAGLRRISVQTVTWNEDGIRFYEALGFRRLAEFPGYFGPGDDLVWLDREIGGP